MEEKFKNIKYLVKEAGIDTPSANFLDKVMHGVENTRSYKQKAYEPLISGNLWVVIMSLLICLVCLALFLPDTEKSVFSKINFSILNNIKIDNPFVNFKFYKATLYGVIFLAILFLIQLPFLKRRIDENFS